MELKLPESVARSTVGPLSEHELQARYGWLKSFVDLNSGIRPSMRDISAGWGVSVTAASLGLDVMEEMGWIEYARNGKGERLDRGLVLKGMAER